MLPNMHPVPGAFLHPLPTPNLNHSNQLEAHRCNVTPTNVASPNNAAPKCGVARKWWRQTMRRQNVASQENVASSNNVAPSNAAPKCGVTGKCGFTKQCGAKQCGAKMWRHRKMWRRRTMWRQTMRRQMWRRRKMWRRRTMWRQTMWCHLSSKCVFIMCLQRQVQKWMPFCQHRELI